MARYLHSSSYKAVAEVVREFRKSIHNLIDQDLFVEKMLSGQTFKSNSTLSSSSYKAVASWSGEGAERVLHFYLLIYDDFSWKTMRDHKLYT